MRIIVVKSETLEMIFSRAIMPCYEDCFPLTDGRFGIFVAPHIYKKLRTFSSDDDDAVRLFYSSFDRR